MYSLIEKEQLIEMFPILGSKETTILNMISADGVSLMSVFKAMKSMYPALYESIRKNTTAGNFDAGRLLLNRVNESFNILTMPIQAGWKTAYDHDYVYQGFLKISGIYKERGIESIAIQEGLIPTDVIDSIIEQLDLPKIVYYKETI